MFPPTKARSKLYGLHGLAIDTSNNNPITAQELRASGAVLLIAKGTEGLRFDDRVFQSQRAAAQACGVEFGGYVFLHQNLSVGDQIREFIRFAKPEKGEFVAIDAEVTDGQPTRQIAQNIVLACEEFQKRGHSPLVYMPIDLWRACADLHPDLRNWWLWEPQYPGAFTRWVPGIAKLRIKVGHGANLAMWQWTDCLTDGGHRFDASRLMVPLDRMRTPPTRGV